MSSFESYPQPDGHGYTNKDGQYVRRIKMPNGRKIEVTYLIPIYDDEIQDTEYEAYQEEQLEDLTVCPECERDLVYPVEWEEVSAFEWEVLLRCPNCEWTEKGVYDQQTVDKFDEALDMGTDSVIRDLKRLTKANMREEANRFTQALENDHILPEDF